MRLNPPPHPTPPTVVPTSTTFEHHGTAFMDTRHCTDAMRTRLRVAGIAEDVEGRRAFDLVVLAHVICPSGPLVVEGSLGMSNVYIGRN